MSLPPQNPQKTNAGIVLDPYTLERVIPASRRKDGSVRKEQKIRAGFVPQEDMSAFRSRRILEAEARRGVVPGSNRGPQATPARADVNGTAAPAAVDKSKTQVKTEKRPVKRTTGYRAGHNWDSETDDDADTDAEKTRAAFGMFSKLNINTNDEEAFPPLGGGSKPKPTAVGAALAAAGAPTTPGGAGTGAGSSAPSADPVKPALGSSPTKASVWTKNMSPSAPVFVPSSPPKAVSPSKSASPSKPSSPVKSIPSSPAKVPSPARSIPSSPSKTPAPLSQSAPGSTSPSRASSSTPTRGRGGGPWRGRGRGGYNGGRGGYAGAHGSPSPSQHSQLSHTSHQSQHSYSRPHPIQGGRKGPIGLAHPPPIDQPQPREPREQRSNRGSPRPRGGARGSPAPSPRSEPRTRPQVRVRDGGPLADRVRSILLQNQGDRPRREASTSSAPDVL